MKKHLVTIILSVVIFFLLFVIVFLCLVKDPWKARLHGLLGGYNNILSLNSKITEELNLLKQEKTTLDRTGKTTTSSTVEFKYKILRKIESPDYKYYFIIAGSEYLPPKDNYEKYYPLGCDGGSVMCHFFIAPKEEGEQYFSSNYLKEIKIKDFADFKFHNMADLDFANLKFIDNENIEYSVKFGDACLAIEERVKLNIITGESATIEVLFPDVCSEEDVN